MLTPLSNDDAAQRDAEEISEELLSLRPVPFEAACLADKVEWQACPAENIECETLGDFVHSFNEALAQVLTDPEAEWSFDPRCVVKAGDKFYAVRPVAELVEITKADQLGHLLPLGDMAGDLKCDGEGGCEREWTEDQLIPLTPATLFSMVKPGDTVPSGLCPVCGRAVTNS